MNFEQEMNFGQAIEALKQGKRVTRSGWNGKGMWLGFIKCEAWNFPCSRFVVLKTVDGENVPWAPSQTDILSEDWSIVE